MNVWNQAYGMGLNWVGTGGKGGRAKTPAPPPPEPTGPAPEGCEWRTDEWQGKAAFCLMCNKFADESHLESNKHLSNLQWYRENGKVPGSAGPASSSSSSSAVEPRFGSAWPPASSDYVQPAVPWLLWTKSREPGSDMVLRCLLCKSQKKKKPTEVTVTPPTAKPDDRVWEECDHYHLWHGKKDEVQYTDRHKKYMIGEEGYTTDTHDYVIN